MTLTEFSRRARVTIRTILKWRTKGLLINLPDGSEEVIKLKTRRDANQVLIPISYDSFSHGFHLLGAGEFLAALGIDSLEQTVRDFRALVDTEAA